MLPMSLSASNATVLAVASGKGGAGKSVTAVNLAETLARQGHAVALVDADWGQGAAALLLNERPATDVLGALQRPEAALHRTAAGLDLAVAAAQPGAADGREAALYAALDRLLQTLRVSHDWVVIDCPAGTDGPVRWALDRADHAALVVVGEPTAVADAYALVKLAWQRDPGYPFALVVNAEDTEAAAESVALRFNEVTRQFLGAEAPYLGWVPYAPSVRASVRAQTPAVRHPGAVRLAFEGLAAALTSASVAS